MKRKVFSLMMLCLFAFLGMASAQPGNNMSVAPDPVDLGYRPLGAWMRPFEVQFTSTTSATQTITAIEADKAFFVIDADLPGTVSSSHPFNFTIMHGEAAEGPVSGQLLAMTSNRTAYLFDIMAIAYNPIEADVVETAPAIELPFSQLVEGEIYDNYLLPGATPDGKDVVYKMTIEDDILFNAEVEGENGKIALYTEGFNGQPGPGADNNFTGITTGGGAGTPFEALIGDENSTTQSYYFPFRTLYDNSIAEQLYLATELAEAGVNTLPMASLSFEAKNSTGKLQQGISIWMANVSDDVLTSTSHNTSNMTLVYTGSVTPLVGWNEFVFNENQFAWDGFSNVLVCVQRNNGDWNSDINWKSHNPGFTALAYNYRDNTGYDMTANTYTVYNSSISRVNTLFKSIDAKNAGRGDNMISDMTLTPGVYYLAASSTSDAFTVSANMDLLPLPEQAVNPSPADGQTDVANPAILSWEFGNYTTAYRVLLGTTYPPTQVLVDWTNELSNTAVASNLANNKTYFWRVDERNTNGITEGQIWGFITTLNIPQNLAAATEKIYEGDALQLSWVPMDRSFRGYNVYQDGVKLNDNLLTAAQYTVNGLTYNMTDGYVFNVTAVYDEGESAFSNDLVAFVTGKGTVSGKVTEVDGTTGIAGVEVTLEGIDEFDAAASYTFTTGANGTFTGPVWAGDYTAWAAKEGYQVAQYDGEFHVTYNETTPNINFILDENWVPLGEVIAEEVDENQVKVYWSQTVMSEIIEDFETGDFSSFDWVNDATYPWTIVGGGVDNSQCMKSGNAGVNSSTSAIEVNVEIGRDGLMSFYHKISSETNWDKGYFYIDGTEMIVVSGAGSWQEKEFPITAGVHNFKWAYTKDGSLSSNDDCWYVDNINFIHDPAPAGAGWIGYDNETNESGVGAGGSFYWGISFPTAFMAQYNGFTMTKVKMFDREPHTGTVSIYQGGESAPGTLVTQQAFTCTGSESYVEVTLSNPVSINPSQSLWIVLYNDNGQYPAACCAYTGDPNSRWVSLDGVDWMELTEAAASLNYSWQIQAYMTDNAKTIVLDHKDVAAPAAPVVKGTPATSLSNLMSDPNATASGNRAFHHFNIYRTTCDDVEAENAEFLGSINDTIYLDNDWATLQPGVYKWGVSRFYQGNRNRNRVTYDFESDLQGWTTIDNDGDGYNWEHSSSDGTVAHSGTGVATSASYINYYGALTPDNWLVSPQVALGGTMTFWAAGQDPSYAQEHFAVYVSTSGTAVSNFTQVMSETVASGTMTQYTVDLSAYSGQGYVAIRHYNVTDMFRLNVDDITLGEGGDDPNPPTPPTPPTPTGGGEITYTGVYGESGVMWSNCLENKMYVSTSITVTLNSGESPEGTTVAMHNISEPDLNMTYNATLDETGIYVWESMRRGTYEININKTGYEPVAETVEIGDVNNLQYELVEIIQAIGDLYVSGTGWAIFGDIPAPVDPDTPPTPPTGGWQEGFENGGIPADWTVVDANNDSYTWTATSAIPTTWTYYASLSLDWYHNGTDAVCSGSYINGVGALNPDEYLIAPQVTPTNGSTFSFWAAATDANYPADHFGVFVSTTGTNPSDFTSVQEWTLTAKGNGANGGRASRDGKGAKLGTWYNYSVDLSAYAGQSIYVAIRHFNCYDQYIMCVDDVEFTTNRGLESYNVKLDDVFEGNTTHPFFQHNVENLVEGETYTTSVQAVYGTGVSEWVSFDWVYTPCDNFEGLKSASAEWAGEDVVLTWELPEGGDVPGPVDPDPPTPPTGDVYDFEDGTPQGWTSIDADGDGFGWNMMSSFGTGYGHNGSLDGVYSQSYDNNYGVLYPDNYFVSPQVALGGQISFWACGQDASYAAEHFGVAVSTTTATANAFTMLQEWTMSAKGNGAPTSETRSGNRAQGNWYQFTVDLSAYAGQTGYVAIRHFNCSDMFYLDVDDITIGESKAIRELTYNFDDGTPQGWTSIDADGDGFGWGMMSNFGTGYGHNGSADGVYSQSYDNNYGVLYPDNYFVSPQVTFDGNITFWACGQDASYAAEHFGVAISTTTATANAFTMLQEWTMTAKGNGAPTSETRSGNRAQGNWYQFTVDLSDYAGQTGYVAIRHFNCSDMFYLDVDDIVIGGEGGDDPNPPVDPPTGDIYDFEDGTPQGWTSIDADGDGFGWNMMSSFGTGYGHNGSLDGVYSQSYDNNYGVLYPDNYFVSPQVTLGGEIKFWACGQDASYAAEHFGVAVSTTTATANAFTMLQEWTMSAKGNGAPTNETRSGNRAQGNWYQFTVDLSAYAGQTGYVAIRHFNCSDMFYLDVDDIELGGGGDDPNPPTPGANVRGVEIFRDGEWIAEVAAPAQTFTDIEPGEVGEYEIRVVYNGNLEDYTHYTMSCPEIVVPVENICIAPENLEGDYVYYNENDFGAVINWTYPEAVDGEWYQYDDGTYATSVGAGEPFKWAIMLPAGSHQSGLVTKVTLWDVNSPMNGSVAVYTGTAAEPQTLLASAEVEFDGTQEEMNFVFNELVYVGANDNIWVVVDNPNSTQYPAAASADVTNDPNGRWVYLESSGWLDLAAAGLPGYSWMIHCYISETLFFEVFRNGELIADVPYNDSEIQTYYDQVGIGNYQYQVIAVTDNCESDFALTPDLLHDFVEIHVTSVTENIATRVYPNPTTGIVTIEANGMNHITVVNTLGQTVLDTNISGDQYQLNLGQFQAGVYMVRIATEEGVSVQRVTVAK